MTNFFLHSLLKKKGSRTHLALKIDGFGRTHADGTPAFMNNLTDLWCNVIKITTIIIMHFAWHSPFSQNFWGTEEKQFTKDWCLRRWLKWFQVWHIFLAHFDHTLWHFLGVGFHNWSPWKCYLCKRVQGQQISFFFLFKTKEFIILFMVHFSTII